MLLFFSFAVSGNALIIVTFAVFLVGLGSIGLMVLGESDADWEHPPEFRGFRPAMGAR